MPSDPDIRAGLAALGDWAIEPGAKAITRTFVFDDFVRAFGFMVEVALLAERAAHHPEWSNVFNRVEVRLTTHDAGGLTARDLELATAMDRLAARRS